MPPPNELRAWATQRLPAALVPSAVVVLPALPHLPNGKVDRAALSATTLTAKPSEGSSPPTALQGPTQTVLAALWRELLQVPVGGANADFFALGGHSLRAVSLTVRIQRARGE